MSSDADFTLYRESFMSSVYLLEPQTPAAFDWIEENIINPESQRMGSSVAIEHRYVDVIIDAVANAGLTLETEEGR